MMTMKEYLKEIRFATEHLIEAVWGEHDALRMLEGEISRLNTEVEDGYERARFIAAIADNPDEVAWAAGEHWNTYFGPDKDRHHKTEHKEEIQEKVVAHAFSVAALSGTWLHFARQGISLMHDGLAKCPPGRSIGSQKLRDVIWQARNQSFHWEEGELRPSVRKCFETLAKEIHPVFASYTKRNLAFNVVSLLEWQNFASFEMDMMLME